jgi:hypothetical protein
MESKSKPAPEQQQQQPQQHKKNKLKNEIKPQDELDFIPLKSWDLDTDTRFVQFLNVPAIEKLYTKMALVDLNKVDEKNFYYIKGSLDTLYALIGVNTPLKRLIETDLDNIVKERLETYVNSVTSFLESNLKLRKQTIIDAKEQKERDSVVESQQIVVNHILDLATQESINI